MAAILDFFKMAANENEGIYLVSYLLFYFMYSNDFGVYYCVSGVKEYDNNVKTTNDQSEMQQIALG